MAKNRSLTNFQVFNWVLLWFICRGCLHVGLFGLSEARVFSISEGYVNGQVAFWQLPITLLVDLFIEFFLIMCGYFTVWIVMVLLAYLGLRKYLERIFGPAFKKEMF
jgi:hypothetical protein